MSNDMKRIRYTACLAGLISLLVWSQAGAEEKLESGKDRIDVPAIGAGLCLHNLFQSGMVLHATSRSGSGAGRSPVRT